MMFSYDRLNKDSLIILFFLLFLLCRGEADLTATFVICFHLSLLLAFSLHFSSSSAFLRSLFTQSSHLSCGLPRFLEPSCLFVLALFGSLSSFIHTMCPFHPALNYYANYTSFSSNFFLQVFHSPSLHSPYSGYFPYPLLIYMNINSGNN